MSPQPTIVPNLVSTAQSIIDAVKDDPSTNMKASALLAKASGAIDAVQHMGAEQALLTASTKLKSLNLGADHPLIPHVDAAKSAIVTAQKLLKLF